MSKKAFSLMCVCVLVLCVGNVAGNSPPISLGGNMTVLIIDDDNDINFADDQSIETFETALLALGYAVTIEEAPVTDDSTWPNYDFIVWSCGDDFIPVLDEQYKISLMDHVNGGGRLIIESGNVAYDLDTNARPSGDLFRNTVLHATGDWIYSDVDDIELKDGGHPLVTTPNPLASTISFTETNPGDTSADADAVRCNADAVGVYGWSNLRWGGTPPIASVVAACNSIIAYDDDAVVSNGGQIVYFTFDIDDIDNENTQDELIENSINWVSSAPVTDDVGVTSIDAPADGGTYPVGTMGINATVENYGTNPQSNFDVSCEIIEVAQEGAITPLLSEDFDEVGALPAGWDNSVFTWRDWQSTNNGGRYGTIVGGTDYGFVCDSDEAGAGSVDSWLISPSFDCSAYGVVELNFTHRYNWYGEVEPEGIYVYVTIDGDVDISDNVVFHEIGPDIALTTENIDISSIVVGQADVRVGLRYVGDFDYWWVVDDIIVNGIVPQIENTVYGPINQTITASLDQNDTVQLSWNFLFSNSTDYKIVIRTWLSTDVKPQNNVASIIITITSQPYYIDLVEGWNLVSIPLEMDNTTVPSVLASIIGKWDVVKYYDNTNKSGRWKTYRQGASTNDLANIDNTMGFWIHATEACNLTVSGSTPNSIGINLYAGWNLVGCPTMNSSKNIADALAGTGYDRVEGYDSASPYIQVLAGSYVMTPGEGYWVRVPADVVWTINW